MVGTPVYVLEEEMPPEEMAEWLAYFKLQAEEAKKPPKGKR